MSRHDTPMLNLTSACARRSSSMSRGIAAIVALALFACDAKPDAVEEARVQDRSPPTLRVAPLDTTTRTIPYGGYLDFNGQPVNAANVAFNFALFPCANPGADLEPCAPLWVASGIWNTEAPDWRAGWPLAAEIRLPIFSGRFSVELGVAGQNPLPELVFQEGYETLYLAMQIEGRPLGALQRVVPANRTRVSERAFVAESADAFTVRDDLTVQGHVHVLGSVDAEGAVIRGNLQAAGSGEFDGGVATGGDVCTQLDGGRCLSQTMRSVPDCSSDTPESATNRPCRAPLYRCPSTRSANGVSSGSWANYGCEGQLSVASTCLVVVLPHVQHHACTQIGRFLIF